MVQAVISLSILNYHVIRPLHLDLHEIHELPKVVPLPTLPANSCFKLEGTIWLQSFDGCFDNLSGKVAIFVDPPPYQLGSVFDRQ